AECAAITFVGDIDRIGARRAYLNGLCLIACAPEVRRTWVSGIQRSRKWSAIGGVVPQRIAWRIGVYRQHICIDNGISPIGKLHGKEYLKITGLSEGEKRRFVCGGRVKGVGRCSGHRPCPPLRVLSVNGNRVAVSDGGVHAYSITPPVT